MVINYVDQNNTSEHLWSLHIW